MIISEHTLKAVAAAILKAVSDCKDDADIAEAALQAFCDQASLADVDALYDAAMEGR
jgi:hypothetical protein